MNPRVVSILRCTEEFLSKGPLFAYCPVSLFLHNKSLIVQMVEVAQVAKELDTIFREVHTMTTGVRKLVQMVANELDMLVLPEEFEGEFPGVLFRSTLPTAELQQYYSSEAELRIAVDALPRYRAYLLRVSKAYPSHQFRMFIGYVSRRFNEIEGALRLLLTDVD
jgi:hypothetical protein